MEVLAGVLGLLGSILLGVPVYLGLGDRHAFENVENVYRNNIENAKRAGTAEETERRLREARETYESDRDGIIADVLGKYRSNYLWTVAGFAALFLSLFFLIFASRGAG